MKLKFYQSLIKRNTKKYTNCSKIVFIVSAIFYNSFQLLADCTVTSSISASNFLATYGTCTGTLTIPNGVVLTIDAALTIASGINKIVIANGGQIAWTNGNNLELTMAQNTAIIIENTSTTTGVQALSGACNNNDEIFIGTVQYAVCVGGGACIDFATLTANGGTIQIDPTIVVGNGTQTGNVVCSNTFDLNVAVNGFVYGTPTYLWTQTSGPGTSTFSTSNTVQTPTVTTTALGVYTYKVEVTVPLSSTCLTTFLTVNSTITVDVQNCVQPVDLVSFVGTSTPAGNELTWETSSEESFSHFEVEKSVDAKAFKMIGKVKGNGNTKETLSYTYLDSDITSNILGANKQSNQNNHTYYRLKMVDLDGKTEYSKILFVKSENEISTVGLIYPNPMVNTESSISITSSANTNWTFITYDMAGKVLSTEIRTLKMGLNKLSLSTDKFSKGISIIRFENADGIQYRKVIK